jgi:hypothetical protein
VILDIPLHSGGCCLPKLRGIELAGDIRDLRTVERLEQLARGSALARDLERRLVIGGKRQGLSPIRLAGFRQNALDGGATSRVDR